MIRVVVKEIDYTLTQVNGPCSEHLKTFDVDAPVLEQWLHEFDSRPSGNRPWVTRTIVGVETRPEEQP